MGRGLSDLQRNILALAYEQDGPICANDVLEHIYKLTTFDSLTAEQQHEIVGEYNGWKRPTFVRWCEKYNRYFSEYGETERPAACRSFVRLLKRGLLRDAYSWSSMGSVYYRLTDEGKELMVNPQTKINR